MNKQIESQTIRYRQLSEYAPAVRMVYVQAWAGWKEDGGVGCYHHVNPVIAVRSYERFEYGRMGPEPCYGRCLSVKELREEGWHLQGRDVESVPLVVDAEGNIVDVETLEGCRTCGQLVVCPWPVEEDAARLADCIAALENDAVSNMMRREQERQKERSAPNHPPRTT